jgi:hypothetical protein
VVWLGFYIPDLIETEVSVLSAGVQEFRLVYASSLWASHDDHLGMMLDERQHGIVLHVSSLQELYLAPA